MNNKSLNIKLLYFCMFFSLIFLFNFCKNNQAEKSIFVDFSNKAAISSSENVSEPPLNAALSAMISPKEGYSYYSKIFDYISDQIGRKITFKQRKTYQEVNDLLRLRELDFAFICSGAYVEAYENFKAEILAVPQVKGNTEYYAYLIVRRDSGIDKFEDLAGKSFAYTDPLSNTGCLYPQFLVKKQKNSLSGFFEKIIYTYAHDYSIKAVDNQLVLGASVDSLIFDYIKETHPEDVLNLKIIKKSQPFGMPPLVVHPGVDPEIKKEIQITLLEMNSHPEGREILSHLFIERFVLSSDDKYDSIREMKAFLSK